MPLSKNEQLLVEAINSMLNQDAKLGLAIHDEAKDTEHTFQYLHEQINDMFAVKSAELVHCESVRQAFHKVHNYKYLNDPTFLIALDKEMISTAVPAEERRRAIDFIPKIIEELQTENDAWAERDYGFNPALDEIKRINKPKQNNDFKIHDSKLNKKNVTSNVGEASPGHI